MMKLLQGIMVTGLGLASAFECSQFDSNMGANFDLSDLVR
jgi:hypothetical protein